MMFRTASRALAAGLVRTPAARLTAILVGTFAAVLVVPAVPAAAVPSWCPPQPANLAGQHITSTTSLTKDLTCADVHGAVFDGLRLHGLRLVGADLHDASFRHADLHGINLNEADLRGAVFDYADMWAADIRGADARYASFRHATLDQSDLVGTNFEGAHFDHANLTQTDVGRSDLRGASLWWTDESQIQALGTRVDRVQPGEFQLAWLSVVAALVLLVRAVVLAIRARGRKTFGAHRDWFAAPRDRKAFGRALVPAVVLIGTTLLVVLIGAIMVPLFLIERRDPLLIASVVAVVAVLIRAFTIPRQAGSGWLPT